MTLLFRLCFASASEGPQERSAAVRALRPADAVSACYAASTAFTGEVGQMPRGKMVYVSDEVHHRLKLLAARRNRPMGEVVEELVEQELAELANPWTSPSGLILQQAMLARVWDDPALDVYDND